MKRMLSVACILFAFGATGIATAQSQDSQPAKAQELTVVFPKADIGFNPLHAFTSTEAQLYTAIYEGLVTYNPLNLDPLPGVASSWDISKDGKVYTFHLRSDAYFANGQPVTAQDFRNSWLHLLAPATKAQYSFLLDPVVGAKAFRLGETTDPNTVGIKALSAHELQVTLAHPASQLLKVLCHYSFVPIPPAYLDKVDWRDQTTIPSNGPFRIVKHNADEIDLVKNDRYWDAENVDLSKITILLTDDAAKVTKMFDAGKIQWATGSVNWNQVRDRRSIIVNPLFATSYFFFKADRKPWDNAKVRRGLALLLPWKKIRQDNPLYLPTSTLVPKLDSYPKVTGITEENDSEAMRLLAEAGYPAGKGLPPVTISIPGDSESKRVADIMAASWERSLGLTVKVEVGSYPSYYQHLDTNNYTLATTTWIGDFADPLTFLQMWTASSNLNDGGYKDSAFDAKIHESMSQSSPKRYETLAAAETILLHGAEVLPIDNSPAVNLVKVADLVGWFPNPLDIHPFKYIGYRTPEPIPGVAQSWGAGVLRASLSRALPPRLRSFASALFGARS